MKLKQYQEKVLGVFKNYLIKLSEYKAKYDAIADPEIAEGYDFAKKAFQQIYSHAVYYSKTDGLGNYLPDVYFKIPTGGGKTLLACHSIDMVQRIYLKRQSGLVLWVVPSTQIYRQTIKALKDREHPYRIALDMCSGGKTLIKEKTEIFSPGDVEDNLVVLMLMLPSANRQNKETLKLFKDSGGFAAFFPEEDNYPAQAALLRKFPNLEYFGADDEFIQKQLKTSLGNTLKILQPLIILDEGHKAYAEQARSTIANFNPSFVLELSATPPDNTNQLVKISGKELHDEGMIKLDIHLVNKQGTDWHNTMLAAFEKRNALEIQAKEYDQNTDKYIRPICLIQVERTGKDQRGSNYIHAEDAKEYLVAKCNVPLEQVAIKSSEKDDIEGIDLFSPDCPIRYIITKQALQEGWDCSFAYVLAILTNPASATAITQLVGRILRQPEGTKIKEESLNALNECYVFTYRPNAHQVVKDIAAGLQSEGLGDLAGRISLDSGTEPGDVLKTRETAYRQGFKKFEGKIYLPKFLMKDEWRDLVFETDILTAIPWGEMDISAIEALALSSYSSTDQAITLGLSDDGDELLKEKEKQFTTGSLQIDEAFLARQISDIIPNPWIAWEIGHTAISLLQKRYNREIIASNFIFVIEELKKILETERNIKAEAVFRNLLDSERLFFYLEKQSGYHVLPSRISVKSNKWLTRTDNSPVAKSLFDYQGEEDFNETEKTVAIYLDEQEKLLWWYRNRARKDFHIQGWRKNKIYPDFIAGKKDPEEEGDYETVYVLETKGIHLKDNDDTRYKTDVFKLCTELGAKVRWADLFEEAPDHSFEFQVIHEDEWQNRINAMMR